MPLIAEAAGAGRDTVFGVDYAWGRPGTAALKKAGVKFVCRYLSHDTSGKNLSPAEAADLSDAGISIVVVWESGAKRALDGRGAGASDAREAARQATVCGMPADRPIYFAVDFNATAGQQDQINAYLDGIASVIGRSRVGLYGGYGPVQRALDARKATWAWQTYAWSAGKWDTRAQIQQYSNGHRLNGAGVDYDRAMTDDYGQWKVGETPVTLKLVSRKAWGARSPKAAAAHLASTRGVKVHYTGDHVDPALVDHHDRCDDRVRSIQNDHMDGNGWNDIGYSMVVCPHGYAYMGRGPHALPAANGPGLNSGHYAVCGLVGNSGLTEPSDPMLNGIRDAIDYLRQKGAAGDEIKGHRDGYATDCPGEPLYAWVRDGAPRPTDPTPQEETLKTVVDLGSGIAQTIQPGTRQSLVFETEWLDPNKIHTDAKDGVAYPSLFPAGADAPYEVTVEVILSQRPAAGAELIIARYQRKTNDLEIDIRGIELVGARETLHSTIRMSKDHKYRADVVNNSGAPIVVDKAFLIIAH